MLRTLREGLQTIEYPQEKSCELFSIADVGSRCGFENIGHTFPTIAEQPPTLRRTRMWSRNQCRPVQRFFGPLECANRGRNVVSPTETRDTGFMEIADMAVSDPPHPAPDFEDTNHDHAHDPTAAGKTCPLPAM